MQKVTYEQLIATLRAVGLESGDGVMVHASIQFLGIPEGGVKIYYDALHEVLRIGQGGGTLVVPAFNFGFAHGKPFDQMDTPSEEMGALAEYVRLLPGARRSPHPMHSVAIVGHCAEELASIDTLGAFDPGSVFEKLVDLDFKLLLLGADVYYTTMIHYSERRANVPYRYWKEFTGPVKLAGKPWDTRTYRMFARDLELDPQVHAGAVQRELERRGLWSSERLNYGQVASCRFRDFVAAADELLAADPWVLVVNRPAETKK